MASKTPLDLYKNISVTTSQMLAAAQDQDWDLLTELEKNCTQYTEALKRAEVIKPVGEAFASVKVGYIKKILDDDKKIRNIVSPWMNKLEGMMSLNRVQQKVAQKYQQ
jgi:flagellar protein FliT